MYYLKRNDFINSVDSNRIWSKSMTMPEIKTLLEQLAKELSEHDFDTDKDFVMNARRKVLEEKIKEQLKDNNGNAEELVSESLFNLWEFVGDEYGGVGSIISDYEEHSVSVEELDAMDKRYREKGIISAQEKDIILEIIQLMLNYINEKAGHING